MIEMHDLCQADPDRGRFRSFLLSMLKHFMADQWDWSQAQKRGGGKKALSLDFADAETRYKLELSHQLSPRRHTDFQSITRLISAVLTGGYIVFLGVK
jgi:RNA polymerase sigma-70 factor (ECF subfamily)